MKKITALLLSFVLLLSACPFAGAAQFSDVQTEDYFYEEAQMLCAMGIVSGDSAGTLRPYDALSRGEFAKLTVGMLNKMEEAAAERGASRFADVDNAHWAVPYINYVAKSNIIVGYPDATFHADASISYGQAITVVLRALGYDETVVEGFWPDSYVSKAKALELTEGMDFDAYADITRADAFVLICRALETEMYNTKTKLAASFGYTILENAVILSTYLTDDALAAGEIKTATGVYKTTQAVDCTNVEGKKVKLYLNEKQEVAAFAAYRDYPTSLVIKKHLGGNDYLCAQGTAEVEYRFSDAMTVYSADGKSSFAQQRGAFTAGAKITLHGETAQMHDYAYLQDADDIVPVVATKDYAPGDVSIGGIFPEDMDSIVVYRDGYNATLSDIRVNDVIYYNPAIQTMEVYTDKVTGLYEEALPSKANVTQVVVGGRTFEVGSAAATRQLDESSGSFKIDDVVTLLLGKNGDVVGVCNSRTSALTGVYGVLISAGSYITDSVTDTGTTKLHVQLMMADGNVYTYDTAKDYTEYKGQLVRIAFSNGLAQLSKVSGGKFSGQVSQYSRKIGDTAIASGAVLFDLVSNPDGGAATVVKIDFEDLKEINIGAESVIASVKESGFNEAAVILFDNVLRTNVKYGLVEKVKAVSTYDREGNVDATTRTYTVLVDGAQVSVSKKGTFSVAAGTPVAVNYAEGRVESLTALGKADSANKIQALDYNRIKINNKVYTLGSDLLIYYQADVQEYRTLSRAELEKTDVKSITLYKDFTNQIRAVYVSF